MTTGAGAGAANEGRQSRGWGASSVAGGLIALGTIIVIMGLSVVAYFNPLWVPIAQDRADVPSITGWDAGEVRTATDAILSDLVLGPPAFDVQIRGEPVLDDRERSHMADVAGVVGPAAAVLIVTAAAWGVALWFGRRRAWVWRAVAVGAAVLALIGVVVGILVVSFFDAAFLLFHLLFFPQGNFIFDPRTQRLTQLFPESLFVDSAVAIAATSLIGAVIIALLARRRAVQLST